MEVFRSEAWIATALSRLRPSDWRPDGIRTRVNAVKETG